MRGIPVCMFVGLNKRQRTLLYEFGNVGPWVEGTWHAVASSTEGQIAATIAPGFCFFAISVGLGLQMSFSLGLVLGLGLGIVLGPRLKLGSRLM